jgi:hypothetical protein
MDASDQVRRRGGQHQRPAPSSGFPETPEKVTLTKQFSSSTEIPCNIVPEKTQVTKEVTHGGFRIAGSFPFDSMNGVDFG